MCLKKDDYSKVHYASAVPERIDRDLTLPARFLRLLDRMAIRERVAGRSVAIKMHVGGALGYSTIHPLFVKLLVKYVKDAGAGTTFVTDGSVDGASDRGYARQTVGAEVVPAFGRDGKAFRLRRTGWSRLKTAQVSRVVTDADVLVNLSHVKGHGCCGFGGACKNLAMGCVTSRTRGGIHALEGDLKWSRSKCIRCGKCIEECPTQANKFDEKGEYRIFWHNCRMCQHCMLICPVGAITIAKRDFDLMQEAMARVAKLVVDSFRRGHVFHINFVTDVTIFCDCWGLTTPALVPDVGIFASEDIVAVDDASLRSILVKDIIPGSITPPYRLRKGRHLFEKLHGRDPFAQIRSLEKLGAGSLDYRKVVVK